MTDMMNNFKNFTLSTALTPVQQDLKNEFSIEFCEDETGIDWYHLRFKFSENTLKLVYDSTGLIVSASYDADTLRPLGMSVAEISPEDVPAEFSVSHGQRWIFQDGKIAPEPVNYVAVATSRRTTLMAEVSARIAALTEAQDDGDITSDELTELEALRECRIALRRLDLSTAPDISWPVIPA